MNFSKTILRIFEVRAKPGSAELLKQKLSDTSVAVVAGKPGNLGYFFGEDIAAGENDLVFMSVWKDLDSIKTRFGRRRSPISSQRPQLSLPAASTVSCSRKIFELWRMSTGKEGWR